MRQNERDDQVSKACDNLINKKNTEMVHQPAQGNPYNSTTITVKGHKLKFVDKFTNLGSTLSRAMNIYDEIVARTAKDSFHMIVKLDTSASKLH